MSKRISGWLTLFLGVAGGIVLATGGCGSNDSVTVYGSNPAGFGDAGADAAARGEACGSTVSIGETAPLDIVFLVDRSLSMAGAKWDAVSHAVLNFVNQGFPSPTRVGLSLSPFPANFDVLHDQILTNYHSCDYRLYEQLAVPVGPLDAAAQRSALEAGFARAITTVGDGYGLDSPLYAALHGTYLSTAKLQRENPDHQVILVLVGDGGVTACDQYPPSQGTSAALTGLASAALDQERIRTFAIGLDGTGFTLLKAIAAAGGGAAFQANDQTIDDLLFQMQRIKTVSIGCSFVLPAPPAGRELDPSSVSVDLTSGAGDDRRLSPVAGFAQCATDASFFLDDPTSPTKATLCPSACAALKADPSSRAVVSFACEPQIK